ncbi:MAG TPA: 4a-hydroxytetrahydrobiopterin dehydratase [Thermoanaerobaculia bacterium]|nr:4a-hydroxytetrahydrobiopterin dehydratase [Thermoanaerobaculia bacterium]
MDTVDVTLYTRNPCPLCDKAKAAIQASGVPVRITEVDIDRDPGLRERYTNDIPVIHIAGREAFRHRVDPAAFADHVHAIAGGWRVVDEHHLEKEYTFPDFAQALAFTNRVAALAEEQNHHPDVHLAWGKVRLALWSHDVSAITKRDYRLAAAIGKLPGDK